MNLKNHPPIFVPHRFRAEIEKLSKAALMDIAWDYAMQFAGNAGKHATIAELRERIEIIQSHREQAKAEGR